MTAAAAYVPLAHPSDLTTLISGSVASVLGSTPVWNGTAWVPLVPASNGQIVVADSTQTLGVKYATPPGSPTAIVDGSVDAADLHDVGWGVTGSLGETVDRFAKTGAFAAVTGTLYLSGNLVLKRGVSIGHIRTMNHLASPAAGLVHQWFCLCDQALNVLAVTTDDGVTGWAANAVKVLPLTATYTPVADIPVYVGFYVEATTTMPKLKGPNSVASVIGQTPVLFGSSATALGGPPSIGTSFASPGITALAQEPAWMDVTA